MAHGLLYFFATFLSLALAQQQTCYFTDGSIAEKDSACIDDAAGSASPCCGSGNICLSNGLCFDGLTINRGSCTDQSWDSNLCTQICTDLLYAGLWPCDTEGGYTCEYRNCNDPFTLSAGRVQVNSVLESSLGLNTATRTVTSAAGTITSTMTRFPRGSAIGGSSSGASEGVSTGTAAGIGAGVGVPLLLTAIGATLLFIMERRKRRDLENSSSSARHNVTSAHYAPKDTNGYQQLGYSSGQQGHELAAVHPQELDSAQQRPELMQRDPRK